MFSLGKIKMYACIGLINFEKNMKTKVISYLSPYIVIIYQPFSIRISKYQHITKETDIRPSVFKT